MAIYRRLFFHSVCKESVNSVQMPETRSMWFETWLMHQQYWYILHVSLECHKNIHGSQESSVGMLCNATGWTILSMSFVISPKYLDRLWDPPTLLLNRHCSWVKRDQLDATCFIITLFNAQHVSDINTSILRSLRLICWVTSWVVSGLMCVGVMLQCGYGGVVSVCRLMQWSKLLRMDVLISETCWALNKVIINQVASSWSLFTQLSRWCTVQ